MYIFAMIMKALKCKPSAYIFLHVHLSLYVRTGVYGKYKLFIFFLFFFKYNNNSSIKVGLCDHQVNW